MSVTPNKLNDLKLVLDANDRAERLLDQNERLMRLANTAKDAAFAAKKLIDESGVINKAIKEKNPRLLPLAETYIVAIKALLDEAIQGAQDDN